MENIWARQRIEDISRDVGGITINNFCKRWDLNAVAKLCDSQRDGDYIIFPSGNNPCRSCGAVNRFVFSFGTMADGRFKCVRTCTYCGDSSCFRKLRVYYNQSLAECPQDG